MQAKDRENDILEHIIKYCEEIEQAHQIFNYSKQTFLENSVYRNSVCMCIVQIGELVNHLTDEFKNMNKIIPWKEIKATRNIIAHQYEEIEIDVLWNTSNSDINELKEFCLSKINNPFLYKEVTKVQLKMIEDSNINFEQKSKDEKIIIKYNKEDEAVVMAAISPPDNSLRR